MAWKSNKEWRQTERYRIWKRERESMELRGKREREGIAHERGTLAAKQ